MKFHHTREPSSPNRNEPAIPAADYRLLFESVPDPCLVLDPTLRIVAVNDAYLRATMTKEEEILGRGIFEVFPDNPEEPGTTGVRNLGASLERVLQKRVPDTMAVQKYDIRKPREAGGGFEERCWSQINTPVFRTDNEIAYIIHRVQDVTEFVGLKHKEVEEHRPTEEMRERAVQIDAEIYARSQEVAEANLKLKRTNEELEMQREKLRESEQRFASFMFHLPAAAWMKDLLGRYEYANAEAECIFSMPLSELTGKTDEEIFPPETARQFRENDERVLAEGGHLRTTEVLRQTDGIEHHFIVSKFTVPSPDGQPAYVAGVAFDITERKRAEEVLRFSESRYRALFRDNPTMIFTLDADWKILSVNPFGASQLGYTINELEGQPVLKIFHEDDRPALAEQLHRCLQNPDQVHRWQFRKVRKDGSLLWVEEIAQAVHDLNGVLNILVVCQDITERKRTEEALRLEKNFTDTVINSMPGIFYVFGDQEQLIRWNKRLEEFSGRSPEEMPTLRPHDFVAEEYHGLLESKLGEVFVEHRNADAELLLLDREGRKIPFYCTGSPMNVGDKTYLVGLGVDISERKRAEEALRESESKFSKAFQAAPDLFTISTLEDGRYIEVNEALERTLQYGRDEVIGRTARELNIWENPDDRVKVVRMLREKKKVRDFETRFRSKTGTVIVGLLSAELIEMKGEECLVAITKDITERKRTEEALRKSEKRFSKIFHSVPALIGITTVAEGRCIDVNETCLRILGYRREEMIGKTMLELGVWESKSARDRVIRLLEEHGMVRDLEINFRGKTGKTFTGVFSAELVDFNGDRYILSMVNDITERKQMEEEIERLNTDLAARAAELEGANRELEAFNFTVAHDLRKPLTVINGYCQAIKELCSDKLDEKCRGYLAESYEGTLRMNRLIDALLGFSRLTHVEPRREPVDLSGVAQEVAAGLTQAEPARRVAFRIGEGITVNGDANLLRVVLENLLGNAWKYTGVREEAVIEFGVTEIDGTPACFVRDNGPGFAMADAEKLFLPFQRLPGAEEFRGHGIGLATVERIVRRHGGRVWAESEPGNGATFYFTLS
jgi:PAS domain S-box-containing protein